jgi:hypothetical protein
MFKAGEIDMYRLNIHSSIPVLLKRIRWRTLSCVHDCELKDKDQLYFCMNLYSTCNGLSTRKGTHPKIKTDFTYNYNFIYNFQGKWKYYIEVTTERGTRWRSGWRTALQTGRSRVRFPMVLLDFFHWHDPSGRTMALGSTQPLTEMSTRNISWG